MRRCATCGATKNDGRGSVADNGHGRKECATCREGAAALLAEEPGRWEYGPDGLLRQANIPS